MISVLPSCLWFFQPYCEHWPRSGHPESVWLLAPARPPAFPSTNRDTKTNQFKVGYIKTVTAQLIQIFSQSFFFLLLLFGIFILAQLLFKGLPHSFYFQLGSVLPLKIKTAQWRLNLGLLSLKTFVWVTLFFKESLVSGWNRFSSVFSLHLEDNWIHAFLNKYLYITFLSVSENEFSKSATVQLCGS